MSDHGCRSTEKRSASIKDAMHSTVLVISGVLQTKTVEVQDAMIRKIVNQLVYLVLEESRCAAAEYGKGHIYDTLNAILEQVKHG